MTRFPVRKRPSFWFAPSLIPQLLLIALLLLVAPMASAKDLTLGVLAFRPKLETQKKWQPLADYLTRKLRGSRVQLRILNYDEIGAALKTSDLDFILTNPAHYIQMRQANAISGALATLVESEGGNPLTVFGGVIFTRRDRNDLGTLTDLKGKTIAAMSGGSLGAFQSQVYELKQVGIDVPRDVRMLHVEMPHDRIVETVLRGRADAGFVRTGVLEAMAREGRLDMASLKILGKKDLPRFPFVASTQLYPEWPIAVMPYVDDRIARQVIAALMELEHDCATANACGIHGFTVPADYSPVDRLLHELRLPPFDAEPTVTIHDVWQQYRYWLISLCGAVLVIAILAIRLVFSNRRLAAAQRASRDAETEMGLSLSRLQATLHSTADGILVVDRDGRITDYNEQFARMWGIPLSILAPRDDRSTMEFVSVQLRNPDQFIARVMELYTHPEMATFDVLDFRDGRVFERYSQPQYVNGQPIGRVWSFRDVTERLRMARTLQENEKLLQTIIDSEPECIKLLAADGAVLKMNRAGLKMLDADSFDQIAGKCIYPIIATEYREAFKELNEKVFNGETGTLEFEIVGLKGRRVWLSTYAVPLRNDRNEITAALSITQDVGEQKRAKQQLLEKTEQLEALTKTLEGRIQEEVALRTKNEQLLLQQSKLAAMGEMLGAIAHQWRQPLNILALIVQNIREAYSYNELNEEYIDDAVRKSMSQIRHMSKTIDDFRNFFRPDKEKVSFDAMLSVANVIGLLSAQLQSSDIAFELTCDAHGTSFTNTLEVQSCPDKMINGYRNEFEHVVMNLISNARDAILERREQVGMLHGMLRFVFSQEDGKMIVTVSDNGGGIDPKSIDRIFEPYFTTKEMKKGSGIGLYMSKTIIEEHFQGRLSARNGNEGAEFTIELLR